LVLFTGCSHAGVVNASRHGVEIGKGAPLYAVMGGYHLADAENGPIEQTVKDLKVFSPKIMLPGHCSGWKVKYQIEREMPGILAPSTVGTRFTFV
jgi:7,8-dihydropterin-6-yl-methyl-4-(beta-D-ribofuranosyl)aminobenzene 5'-phosphate synthase